MSLILAALLAARLPLVVRTYDSAGVQSGVLAHAQRSAGTTLAAVGIDPIWRPCHATGCISKPKPREIEIRLVMATALSERGSLGFAAVDVAERAGTLATVYVDRVDALAAQAHVDRGDLLGRTIAHEVGHLLLGTADHAAHGLMRATWNVAELQRERPLDWMFSGREAEEMRRRLAARVEEMPVVEAVTAEAHLTAAFDDPTAIFKRAKRLEPGMRVTVTKAGAAPVVRYFVQLDPSELVVLNLDVPGVPKRHLLNMAIDNPAWMAAANRTIYKDGDVRVGPDGVFVNGRKLAELRDVVERCSRADVIEITKR